MIKPLRNAAAVLHHHTEEPGLAAGALRCALVLCAFVSSFLPSIAFSEPTAAHSSWDELATPYFRHLSVPNDLPSSTTGIAQDQTGFIWIATQDGLTRWDGYRIKLFRHDSEDQYSLPANVVTGLVADEIGGLFVALEEGGVAHYDPISEHFDSLPSPAIGVGRYPALINDGAGGIWLGNNNGLLHWKAIEKRWEAVDFPTPTQISSLLRARDGSLWIGTDRGLIQTPRGEESAKGSSVVSKLTLEMPHIRSLLQAQNGSIWFGTNEGRIGSLTEGGVVRDTILAKPGSAVLSLAELPGGILCAGTGGTGLIFIDEASSGPLQEVKFDPMRPSGLAEDYITHLQTDKSGGLWVGHARGADYLPATNGIFQSLLPSEREMSVFSGSYITNIATLADNKLWFGTEKGGDLLTIKPRGYEVAHRPYISGDALPTTVLHSIAIASNGRIWLGTGQGLFENDKGRQKKFAALADTPVRSLIADDNDLWIGSERQGLLRLDLKTRQLTSFQHNSTDEHGITDNFILGMVKDPQRGIWIGTPHGVNLFDGQIFHPFLHDPANPNSLPSDVVAGLYLDHRGRLWLGTEGAGIALLEGDPLGNYSFRRIGRKQGLPSENVDAFIEDKNGRLWVSTDAGIAVIDPDTFSVQGFTAADGMAISSYFPNATAQMSDGTLLFGGLGGVTIVHPDRVAEWTFRPEIAITSVRIGQQAVPLTYPLLLPPNAHNLQIEFSSLDYSAPEKNRYSYKLEGFDKDWIVSDADHRLAAYTNLPPGNYSLLLRGSNHAGVWTDKPTHVAIVVLPAWYQTLLFRAALILAATAAVIGLVRSRTALLRRRQKELENQVAERTSEIASLLHNSGEGFLSFGPDLTIDRQYSRACETFLGEKPDGKNAAALLFAENSRHMAFVSESVPSALGATDAYKRDLILSLLPTEIDRRGRRLKTHYAVLENGHLMVVLRDISTERRLAERIASEHRRLGMIVAAITDSRDFFNTLNSFRSSVSEKFSTYVNSYEDAFSALKSVYRLIHTFKGEFNQLSFEKMPKALHDLEERLDELTQQPKALTFSDIEQAISPEILFQTLDQDLAIVRKALGDDFVAKGGQVTMTPDQAAQIKQLVKRWRKGETINLDQLPIRQLIDQIDKIGTVSLHAELLAYDQTIAQVALRLDKEVSHLRVSGGENVWIDPDVYGSFLRSLIHVFRNCVAHGIETPDVRVEAGKDELGQISCAIQREGNELKIEIADDGAGIDVTGLRAQVVKRGYCTAEVADRATDQEIISYIFKDHISTAGDADEWSGRGVGLAVVRQEVEALGGDLYVETTLGKGSRFIIRLGLFQHAAYQAV